MSAAAAAAAVAATAGCGAGCGGWSCAPFSVTSSVKLIDPEDFITRTHQQHKRKPHSNYFIQTPLAFIVIRCCYCHFRD